MAHIQVRRKVLVGSNDAFVPLAPGQYSTPIQVRPEYIYNYLSSLEVDPISGDVLGPWNLANLNGITSMAGVPQGTPPTGGWGFNNFDTLKHDRYNHNATYAIFDLEGAYSMDYAYIWFDQSGNTLWGIQVETSRDGANWNVVAPSQTLSTSASWRKIEFNPEHCGGVRYVKISSIYEITTIRGFILYGRKTSGAAIRGLKARRFTPHRRFEESFGTNGFAMEEYEMVARVSGSTRFYTNADWVYEDEYKKQGTGIGKHPDEIGLLFETAHMGNTDMLYQGFVNTGQKLMLTINDAPAYLRATSVSGPGWTKPVDPGLSHLDVSVTTNPMSYHHIARFWYNLAARYGSNKNADVSMIKIADGEVSKTGLGLLYVLEPGNEWDGYWKGVFWFSPAEMAAYMSALYDGHMNQMGPGYGIKNADPSMLMSNPSFVSSNTAYMREMILWWDANRGKGNYPIDVINLHIYNSSSQLQQVDSSDTGLPPEAGEIDGGGSAWNIFRNTFMPSAEIWLTEFGYDEHWGGTNSPPSPDQFTRSRFKAYWLCRSFLVLSYSGIDVSNQYWFASVGGGRFEDFDQSYPRPELFATSALVDGNTDGSAFWGREPLMSFWYLANFKTEINGYSFMHAILVNGEQVTNEVIFQTASSNVWALAFENLETGARMVIAWLRTTSFQSEQVVMRVPETSVQVVVIDEAEVRESDSGVTTLRSTTAGSGSRLLTLTLNECPQIIKTSNIGTKLPTPPSNIRTERINKGYMLVVWDDLNIENYTTQIMRSTQPNTGFVAIYTGYVRKAEYVDTTAQANTTYYYKVNLLP